MKRYQGSSHPTWIIGVESEHTDDLTTTTVQIPNLLAFYIYPSKGNLVRILLCPIPSFL